MLRPRRFDRKIDPGPVQIRARRVHFDLSGIPLEWIPGHPVASTMMNLFNVVLPAAEHWFVKTYSEALPLVKDSRLAENIRGFIGQEATHDHVIEQFLVGNGVDPAPIPESVQYLFEKVSAPTTSTDPERRLNNLCERLWLIAAIEHDTAVPGDFALNSSWDRHRADPSMVDLFRWHGSEEVEHRCVAHDAAMYFHDSYPDRIRAMTLAATVIFAFFQRGTWYRLKSDPNVDIGWWQMQRLRMRDSQLGLPPKFRNLFGVNTLTYFRPGYAPEEVGSALPPPAPTPTTAQATTVPTTPQPAPAAVIGADCARVGSTGTTGDGYTAYCEMLQITGASIWPLTARDIPSPTVTTEATDEPLPFAEESPVRVCMQQTGQTRRECRRDIRESNGLPVLP